MATLALLCASPACEGGAGESSSEEMGTTGDGDGDPSEGDGDGDATDTSMGEVCESDEVWSSFQLVDSDGDIDWDLLCTLESLAVTDEGTNMLDFVSCASQSGAEAPAELQIELWVTGTQTQTLPLDEGGQLRLRWIREGSSDYFTLRDAAGVELLVAGARGALLPDSDPGFIAPLELDSRTTDCQWVQHSFECGWMERWELELSLDAQSVVVLDGRAGQLMAEPGYQLFVDEATYLHNVDCDDVPLATYDYLIVRE